MTAESTRSNTPDTGLGAEALLQTSKTVCMAPWVHVHLSSLGDFTPCCEVFEPVGSGEGETLVSHWTSEEMGSFRTAMLKGEPLAICRKCYDKEAAGIASRRQRFNALFGDQAHRLIATTASGQLPQSMQPIDLDLRFSNLCNFRCRSCWHGASSRWFSDAAALGLAKGTSAVITAGADREATFAEVVELLPTLRSIYFGGGEPLLMEEHYDLLDALIRIGRRDIQLTYNTNLSELGLGERRVTALWREFDQVRVGASADGMGAVGELVRKGMKWSDFEDNVRTVRESCPHVVLTLAATVSVLNVFHIPDFYRHVHEVLGFGHDAIHLNPLQEPRHYNVQMLPRPMKAAAAAGLRALADSLPENRPSLADIRPKTGRAALLDVIAYMAAHDDGRHIPEFLRMTERLDALRGEDTFAAIPELAPLRAAAARMRTPWGRAKNYIGRLRERRA